MEYLIGSEITVAYQPTGARTGVTATMNVYDEAGVKDTGQSGDMTEVGTTGRYTKTFTPDAAGYWLVLIDDNRAGRAVATYRVVDPADVPSPPMVA
jgi:hypothetical protein